VFEGPGSFCRDACAEPALGQMEAGIELFCARHFWIPAPPLSREQAWRLDHETSNPSFRMNLPEVKEIRDPENTKQIGPFWISRRL